MKKNPMERVPTPATEACDAQCPERRAAQVLDGKWTTLILRDLLGGKKRYSELQRSLRGISPRLLALRLRTLEEHHILTRTQFPTIPPTTEYALTARGQQLLPVIEAMAVFGASLGAN
jgi:DNA-binding HxlR family transcriptional regulator